MAWRRRWATTTCRRCPPTSTRCRRSARGPLHQLDLEQFRPALAGDEQALVLRVPGDAVEYVVAWIRQLVDVEQARSEEHTSELQSLMRISYAVFCLKKKNTNNYTTLQLHHMLHEPN